MMTVMTTEEIKKQMKEKIRSLGVTTGKLIIRSVSQHDVQYELCLQTKSIKLKLLKNSKSKEIIFDFYTDAVFENQKKGSADTLMKLSKFMKQISKDVVEKKATFELEK